jgi:hypothetical protein
MVGIWLVVLYFNTLWQLCNILIVRNLWIFLVPLLVSPQATIYAVACLLKAEATIANALKVRKNQKNNYRLSIILYLYKET